MKWSRLLIEFLIFSVFALALLGLIVGCASRPQTCPPHDKRCAILVEISKL